MVGMMMSLSEPCAASFDSLHHAVLIRPDTVYSRHAPSPPPPPLPPLTRHRRSHKRVASTRPVRRPEVLPSLLAVRVQPRLPGPFPQQMYRRLHAVPGCQQYRQGGRLFDAFPFWMNLRGERVDWLPVVEGSPGHHLMVRRYAVGGGRGGSQQSHVLVMKKV